jgi:hypothetical protein
MNLPSGNSSDVRKGEKVGFDLIFVNKRQKMRAGTALQSGSYGTISRSRDKFQDLP